MFSIENIHKYKIHEAQLIFTSDIRGIRGGTSGDTRGSTRGGTKGGIVKYNALSLDLVCTK